MHKFKVEGLGSDLRVVRFDGHEGMSQLYHFDVLVACAENDIVFADVVGHPAVLTCDAGAEPRYFHGIVSTFEQGDDGKKLTAYQLTIVPAVWRLQHRRDSRIFQELSTPDILKKVLGNAGVTDFKLRLSGSYAAREYCVQYRESDWSFMCRLMEEEGIHYYFEHAEDKDVLVLGDSAAANDPISGAATVPFRPPLGALIKEEHVSRFHYRERVRPGKVTLRDYNFKKPSLSLESSDAATGDTDLEIYDYPGDYEAPPGGSAFAKARLEMLQATRKTADGESACPRLTPGYKFTLADHGRDELNAEYLITQVTHRGFDPTMGEATGADTSPYQNSFGVIPASVPFRPAQVTPWPTIKGIQTAIVVGPGGDEIYTDVHGRIKVQFHWDRQGKKDEHSSCWMRVSQIWAGAAWGAVFIPRIGHEVVVDFLEGDPDRPLVVGSVYHGTNVPPYPLPGDKTRSTVKSNSSVGGGGSNELRFEDKKGNEEIYLHGQKDWTIAIEHDKNQKIGHDETLTVGHDRDKTVKNDQRETIGGSDTEKITGSESLTVGGSRTVSVAQDHSESIGASQSITVGTDLTQSVGGSMSLTVAKDMSATVSGGSAETVSKDKSTSADGEYTLTIGKDMTVTVGKSYSEDVKETRTIIAGKEIAIQCGDSTIVMSKDGKITIQGKDITVKCDGPIKVEGKKLQVKSDGAVDVQASGNITLKGSKVGVN